ncbi:hypothetical protein O988_03681, partial [Pseudogymnoascus sp. VKM F-3808]
MHPPRAPHLLSPPPTQAPLQPQHRTTNLIPNRRLLLLHHDRAMAEPEARAARRRYDDLLSLVPVHGAVAGSLCGAVSEAAGVADSAVADAAVGDCAVCAWHGGALFAAEAGGAGGADGAGRAGAGVEAG